MNENFHMIRDHGDCDRCKQAHDLVWLKYFEAGGTLLSDQIYLCRSCLQDALKLFEENESGS